MFLTLLACLTSEQGVLGTPQTPEAMQIVQRLYRGADQVKEVEDLSVVFTLKKNLQSKDAKDESGMDIFSKGKIFFKKPNKLRVETTIMAPGLGLNFGTQIIRIRDGTTFWQFVSGVEYAIKKRSDERTPFHLLPYNLQTYPQDVGREYTLLGQETIQKRPAYVVGITNKFDPEKALVKLWVDRERWVPLKMEITRVREGKQLKTLTLYKNIGETKDHRFLPQRLDYYEGGRLSDIMIYEQIGVNYGIPDTLFAPETAPLTTGGGR